MALFEKIINATLCKLISIFYIMQAVGLLGVFYITFISSLPTEITFIENFKGIMEYGGGLLYFKFSFIFLNIFAAIALLKIEIFNKYFIYLLSYLWLITLLYLTVSDNFFMWIAPALASFEFYKHKKSDEYLKRDC
ncbi:hypothetical protein RGQ13_12810 [Thalassotalea psychrophila]|uniref:Uncharacterized protein n=1 Tax=Thalassotalea psychrophila TaxID=3065647 RepID=A0ABY9TQJ4_9GAMM|nr:hypothetical protein RGQ13_12810 [Colwelliaceae bacterium SQ149]